MSFAEIVKHCERCEKTERERDAFGRDDIKNETLTTLFGVYVVDEQLLTRAGRDL